MKDLPFKLGRDDHFFQKLGEYVGDFFYEIMPEHGYELRDEQIYMAFQLEQAFISKKTIFAEAGVGTGKTIVYLMYAILYARYLRKPAIIACADETLIEQIVKKGGDKEKLEQMFQSPIDVRLAKARENYICVKKLDNLILSTDDEEIHKVYDQIPSFVFQETHSMDSYYRYGDRKEYEWLSDDKWEEIAYDPLQQCSVCDLRHRCGQTLNREYYKAASDLMICSHDFYMEHIWTKESRKREGQLPLLPEASSIIFDEGHLLEFAAQKAFTYRFNSDTLTKVLTGYTEENVREETLFLIEEILLLHDEWFDEIREHSQNVVHSTKMKIERTPSMINIAQRLFQVVEKLLDELVFDVQLFTMDRYYLNMMEEYLDFFLLGIKTFLQESEGIIWVEENRGELSLVIMPRLVDGTLSEEVFSKELPIVFSSATLSKNQDFSYITSSLGINKALSFSVNSPFDYESKMSIDVHILREDQQLLWEELEEALIKNEGKSLILFRSKKEMEDFRKWANNKQWPFSLYFEGDQEISLLVEQFQNEISSVLLSYHLWEGLDIPGESLTQVLIPGLPFPPEDPVFEAKRKATDSPFQDVDLPFMILRLRQGMGRLIRTQNDSGAVTIWMKEREYEELYQELNEAMPTSIRLKNES
ncbi:ATP-dependent helicase [Bacillus sp. TS-2]|nr:ATP-dependent helicase [Bacillus sp. TS-2]